MDEINRLFLERGWCDGLPIIPPTRERVGAFPAVTGHDPWNPNYLVQIVSRPERLMIALAGAPIRTNAYALANDGPHGWWTSKPIDLDPSLDLVCTIDFSRGAEEPGE